MQQQHIPMAQPVAVPGQMHMGAAQQHPVEYETPAWAGLCW